MKFSQYKDLTEQQKFEDIVSQLYAYYPQISALVKKFNGSDEDCKDIFQDGIIIFVEKLKEPDFQLTCKPETFFYSVCHNLVRIHHRKASKSVSLPENSVPDWSVQALEEKYEEEKRFNTMDKILTNIGDKCKAIFKLYYFKKKSMQEIVAMLNLSSVQVAKNRKYKCLERAKKMLKESPQASSFFTSNINEL